MASLLAAGMQTATWLSAGTGEAAFSSRLTRTRATKHGTAREETEVAAGAAVAARARAVWSWSTSEIAAKALAPGDWRLAAGGWQLRRRVTDGGPPHGAPHARPPPSGLVASRP
jgi:hypothetical protein